MTEPTQHHGPDTARHFRRLYLVALSVIAALAIGGQILVQRSLTSQRDDGHFVNKAGYQRMLSQRLTLKLMLHDPAAPDAAGQRAAIATMRNRWVSAHEDLEAHVGRIAYGEAERQTLSNLLVEARQPLRQMAALATQLVQSGPLSATERATLMADQELFLPLMDSVVIGFEHSVQARVAFLQRVELILLALTLAVLALEALLIFRPAVNRLQSSLDALELRNRQATRRLDSLRHLAGGIAHSFNNVLTGILGHAELERFDALRHRRGTEYLDAQISGCRRAADIIAHLVKYSGHGHYDCKPTVLGSWLAAITRGFTPGDASIRIEFDLAEEAVADIDRAALREALEGILVNAVEAMKDRPGAIVVRLSQVVFAKPRLMSGPYRTELPAGLYACLAVTDSGKGIASEELDRIFDPYYTSKEFGRGLGLASILGIVHGHNGGIAVESTPGRGATVSLFLPLTHREARSPGGPVPKDLRPAVY